MRAAGNPALGTEVWRSGSGESVMTLSEMTMTVKSREVQRGMLAKMGGNAEEASEHFLAAAHLELVLFGDYEQAGDGELARRSRISAASCFWRAGEIERAQSLFEEDMRADRTGAGGIQVLIDELNKGQRA
jgi:hypothetical protein